MGVSLEVRRCRKICQLRGEFSTFFGILHQNLTKYFGAVKLGAITLSILLFSFSDLSDSLIALMNKVFEVTNIGSLTLVGFLRILIISLSLFALEIALKGWQNSAMRRLLVRPGESEKGDLLCWLLSIFGVFDFITFILSFGLFYLMSMGIYNLPHLYLGSYINNAVLAFVVIFVLGDLKHYLWHRFMHQIRFFWELHKYHHSATSFNFITNSRGHFYERGLMIFFDSLFFALIGTPPISFILIYVIREMWAMILHSNFEINLGWLGRNVFVTPQYHRIHHSTQKKHFNKNYGTFFVFWDRLFGSYHEPEAVEKIGVKSEFNKSNFAADMIMGIVRAFKALIPTKSKT